MTEDEYIRYLVYCWKRDCPDGTALYPLDDGCNCLHRTRWEWEKVKKTTTRCHCMFVEIARRRAGIRYVRNENPWIHPKAKASAIAEWRERMLARTS